MDEMCVKCTENTHEKCVSKCIKCQFYCKVDDTCTIKNVQEFSKKDYENCTDYMINEKLIMF